MEKALLTATLVLYAFTTLHYLVYILYRNEKVQFMCRLSLAAAIVLHSSTIVTRWVKSGHFPATSLHESLSIFSLLIAAGYLILELKHNIPVIGAFVSPLNLIFFLAAFFTQELPKPLPPALRSHWLTIHAATSFLGEAAFTLSFVVSVVYILQEREIKKKRMGFFFTRLPPLNKLDDLNYKILTVGFPLLTIGIITGAVWANYAWGSYWSWDPKETWSLITWLVYGGILHGRLTAGWRGRRAALFCIVGFACVMFTFLGVNLLLPGLHTYSSM